MLIHLRNDAVAAEKEGWVKGKEMKPGGMSGRDGTPEQRSVKYSWCNLPGPLRPPSPRQRSWSGLSP